MGPGGYGSAMAAAAAATGAILAGRADGEFGYCSIVVAFAGGIAFILGFFLPARDTNPSESVSTNPSSRQRIGGNMSLHMCRDAHDQRG